MTENPIYNWAALKRDRLVIRPPVLILLSNFRFKSLCRKIPPPPPWKVKWSILLILENELTGTGAFVMGSRQGSSVLLAFGDCLSKTSGEEFALLLMHWLKNNRPIFFCDLQWPECLKQLVNPANAFVSLRELSSEVLLTVASCFDCSTPQYTDRWGYLFKSRTSTSGDVFKYPRRFSPVFSGPSLGPYEKSKNNRFNEQNTLFCTVISLPSLRTYSWSVNEL